MGLIQHLSLFRYHDQFAKFIVTNFVDFQKDMIYCEEKNFAILAMIRQVYIQSGKINQ